MTVRSNHNSLLNYLLYDKKDLSKDYVKKCEQFIDKLIAKRVREAMNLKSGEVDDDHSELQQKGIK